MPAKTKILIIALVIGVVLAAGWWVWEQWFYSLNYCVNLYHEFRNKIEKLDKGCQSDEDCELTDLGICVNKNKYISEIEDLEKLLNKKCLGFLPAEMMPSDLKCKCENNLCRQIQERRQEEVSIITDKTEYEQGETVKITINCFNGCSPETNSLILKTAEEMLKVFQKEFTWMYEPALKSHYLIEVNPPGISGTSYVDYENRIVKLTRIYKPTIAHEIAHLLIAESFGLEKHEDELLPNGPTWLHEGLAMYLEYRVDDSRKAKDISLLKSTSQFLNKEDFMQGVVNDSLKLFYAQSWNLTEFLITKGGKERLRLMIEEVREHPRELVIATLWEESFNKIYQDITPNWNSFYEEWTEYVKQNF